MKTAIVYYSRTNSTKKVAHLIAKSLGADTFQIKSKLYPVGFFGYIKALRHAYRSQSEPIEVESWDLSRYDLVVIGSPIWGSRVSAPIKSFLLQNEGKIKRTAFFVTCGGSGSEKVFKQLSELSKNTPAATLVITAKDLSQNKIDKKIVAFANEIRLLSSPRPKSRTIGTQQSELPL